MNICRRSDRKRWAAVRTIWRIDLASPLPRRASAALNQLKQPPRLLALLCWGSSSATRYCWASASQPASPANRAASWPQPCSTTTKGRAAGSRGGA